MEESVLHSDRNLVITLRIDEDDQASLEILSTRHGPRLENPDDVIAIIDGQGLPLTISEGRRAVALLGAWTPYEQRGFSLAVRVGEFFDGWEFEGEQE